jgi:hypothetical protein
MSKDVNIDLKDLPKQLSALGHKSAPYVPILFFILVAITYGFILLRITTLSNAQPSDTEISTKVSELTPHIDKTAASQLQSLENNNVNVQTLFNQARANPFGE